MSQTLITDHSTVITYLKEKKSASPDEISQAEAYKSWNMLEDSTLCEKINYNIRHELQKHRKKNYNFRLKWVFSILSSDTYNKHKLFRSN